MVSPSELERRLRIQPCQGVALVNAPPEWSATMPVGCGLEPDHADVVVGFAIRRCDLDLLGSLYAAARADCVAWVTYPKPGRLGTDLHRDWVARSVRRYGVEVTEHASIDHTWSALRLQPSPDDKPDALAGEIAWPSLP